MDGRLYPTYEPNTCLISNGLSTMAFALPGAIGAKLAAPSRRVLAAMGDGAFLMNSQKIETALRERVPLTVLIWQDDAYGLIKWKMDLELGRDVAISFSNPDFAAYAESFGARGYRVRSAGDLLPALTDALAADTVSVIAPGGLHGEPAAHRHPRRTFRTILIVTDGAKTRRAQPPRSRPSLLVQPDGLITQDRAGILCRSKIGFWL